MSDAYFVDERIERACKDAGKGFLVCAFQSENGLTWATARLPAALLRDALVWPDRQRTHMYVGYLVGCRSGWYDE